MHVYWFHIRSTCSACGRIQGKTTSIVLYDPERYSIVSERRVYKQTAAVNTTRGSIYVRLWQAILHAKILQCVTESYYCTFNMLLLLRIYYENKFFKQKNVSKFAVEGV